MSRKYASRGFTLIEITIAIFILAASLAVILGLQASSVKRTARDKQEMRAALAARRILAEIEMSPNPPDVQLTSGSALEVLQSVSSARAPELDKDPTLEALTAELSVEYRPIPGGEEQALKEITLRVGWGPAAADSLELHYFIPND